MPRSAIVIGSGPAAAAAVHALLARHWRVTVLDVGQRLDPHTDGVVRRMAGLPVEEWDPQDQATVAHRTKENQFNHSKRIYGSSYPFDDSGDLLKVRWHGSPTFKHSSAFGGLTNIWGASMLPYRDEDLEDWPISASDLAPHYREIMRMVPCTRSEPDDLEDILPCHSRQSQSIRLSSQAQSLFRDLQASRTRLLRHGIRTGKARLAIRALDPAGKDLCLYCALCLSGCPYRLIYSAADSFSHWIREGRITYQAQHQVMHVEETPAGPVVHGRELSNHASFSLSADHVFLAAGILPTAHIVLRSRPQPLPPVRLRDSQYFILPLLRIRSSGNVLQERMHTSCQMFAEVEDPRISAHLVHLQIYGYSAFLREEVMRGPLRFPLRWKWLHDRFFSRLMVVQGFLHSRDSGHIDLRLTRDEQGRTGLSATPARSPKSIRAILLLGIKLLRHCRLLRALPLLPGLQILRPGAGYHSGGSFPMKNDPGPGDTDPLGRLSGWNAIHIVDSSVFPSIPATTITLSAMANAHRIASEAGRA